MSLRIPLGIVLGSSERLYRSLEFVIDFFRSTPASAMFPLFLVLFGVGDETKISVAAFGAILVILFNVAYGVMNARKTRLLAAKVMGASRLRVLFDVMLLELLPQTFVGLRNGVSLALVIIVVAEMFIGSQDGLGHSVFEAQQLFDMPRMYAAIFAAGALGYGLNLLFSADRAPVRALVRQITSEYQLTMTNASLDPEIRRRTWSRMIKSREVSPVEVLDAHCGDRAPQSPSSTPSSRWRPIRRGRRRSRPPRRRGARRDLGFAARPAARHQGRHADRRHPHHLRVAAVQGPRSG